MTTETSRFNRNYLPRSKYSPLQTSNIYTSSTSTSCASTSDSPCSLQSTTSTRCHSQSSLPTALIIPDSKSGAGSAGTDELTGSRSERTAAASSSSAVVAAAAVLAPSPPPSPPSSSSSPAGGGVSGTRWADLGGSSTADCRMVATVPFEPLKWAFLLFYLLIAGLSNWAVLAYTHDFVPREPLPDLVFWLVPEQQWATTWGDLMVTSCLLCLLVLLIFHEQRVVIARRVIFIAATLYAMRSCTLLATQLPSGYENNMQRCRERLASPDVKTFFERLGEQTLRLGFQGGNQMLCGDLLFSGHTLVMIVSTLTVAYYLPSRWSVIRWIPTVFSIFGMTCMVISRTHYSIDIIVAYWLTNFIFRVYHAYCEVDIYIERRQSVLHDLWLCRVVAWLEESIVPGKTENRFSIPFSTYLRTPGHHKQISISSSSTFNQA